MIGIVTGGVMFEFIYYIDKTIKQSGSITIMDIKKTFGLSTRQIRKKIKLLREKYNINLKHSKDRNYHYSNNNYVFGHGYNLDIKIVNADVNKCHNCGGDVEQKENGKYYYYCKKCRVKVSMYRNNKNHAQ